MRSWKAAMVLGWVGVAVSTAARAQDEETCNQIRRHIADHGLIVDMTFEATELFDATQVVQLRRIIKVEPDVGLRRPGETGPVLTLGCGSVASADGNDLYYGFTIGKDARLDIDGRKLAAAIPNNVMFITQEKRLNDPWKTALRFSRWEDPSIEIYHAVAAEIMRGADFETWESAGASNYSKLLKLPDTDMPYCSVGGSVLGIAGRGSKLYQVAVKSYTVDLGQKMN